MMYVDSAHTEIPYGDVLRTDLSKPYVLSGSYGFVSSHVLNFIEK